ncbi:MAG TPA: hypothetical protein DCS45_16280, partial [Roseovarius nubinhibens]|nr:hypothetical protein [Roseovarius nubinhibens]
MTVSDPSFSSLRRLSSQLRPHATLVFLAAGLFATMAFIVPDTMAQVTLGLISIGLLVAATGLLAGAFFDHF